MAFVSGRGGWGPSPRSTLRTIEKIKKSQGKTSHNTLDDVGRGRRRKKRKTARDYWIDKEARTKQLRPGSAPYTHYKLGSMIEHESSLTPIQRAEDKKLRAVLLETEPLPKVDNSLYTTVKTRISMPVPFRTSIPSSQPFDLHHIKEEIHPPTVRQLSDNKTYYTRINIHEGRKTRKRRLSAKLHPTSNNPTFETTKTEACDMIVQTHGINQTGFYCPYDIATAFDQAPLTSKNVMKFLQGQQELWSMARSAVSSTTQSELDNLTDNVDAFFSFDSILDTSTFRNKSEFTPGVIKVYLLQCRRPGSQPPWAFIYEDYVNGQLPSGYIMDRQSLSLTDSETSSSGGTVFPLPNSTKIWTDNAAVLGFTPQMSSGFKEYWSVVDVYKSPVLNPGDQWQVTVKQHLSRMLSWRESYADMYPSPTLNQYVDYRAGDYELLIQFQGAPGFCTNTKIKMSDDGVTGNRLNTIQTFSNPMMISRTRKSSIVTNFPSSIATGVSSDLCTDLFDTVQAKKLDTNARTYSYFPQYYDPSDDTSIQYNWRAVAMSDTEQKTADFAGI